MASSGDQVLRQGLSWVLVSPRSGRSTGSLVLVPRPHVGTLADLPLAEMGDVLAGLSRAAESVRESWGVGAVKIRPYPRRGRAGRSHVHFHVLPGAAGGAAQPSASRARLTGRVTGGRT
ncbi:MAG: HIT family protein [Acidimicrobiales bacterium]